VRVDYVGRNGMLKKFDYLRIEQYEIVRGAADWYDLREIDILGLVVHGINFFEQRTHHFSDEILDHG
jgi:hypothetical protein